jgi:hypothetical protein
VAFRIAHEAWIFFDIRFVFLLVLFSAVMFRFVILDILATDTSTQVA